jgi:uncharacterized Fe-S center protein
MKANVYFATLGAGGKTILDKLSILLDRTDLKGKIREKDLVAIKLHFGEDAFDQASVDLVNQQSGSHASRLPKNWENGEDKFRALYPEVDWSIQLSYAEEIGLGTRDYELIKI